MTATATDVKGDDACVTSQTTPTPRDRLFRVVLRLGDVRDTWVKNAVEIASTLVGEGDEGPSTLAVACLSSDAIQSDAEPLIRAMVIDQGAPFLPENADDERLTCLLVAFAHGVVGVGELLGEFYSQLPAWDRQDDLQRELVVALDRWETETDPGRRRTIEDAMRGTIPRHFPGA